MCSCEDSVPLNVRASRRARRGAVVAEEGFDPYRASARPKLCTTEDCFRNHIYDYFLPAQQLFWPYCRAKEVPKSKGLPVSFCIPDVEKEPTL